MTEQHPAYKTPDGKLMIRGRVVMERLAHCNCAVCGRYWSLSDPISGSYVMACPHCQQVQLFDISGDSAGGAKVEMKTIMKEMREIEK